MRKNSTNCSDENIPFYEKIGYSYHGNTMKIQNEQDMVPRRAGLNFKFQVSL